MRKVKKPLTALRVKRMTKVGRHADGKEQGLYLAVSESGAKSWIFMWVRKGKRNARGLGSANTTDLAKASASLDDARALAMKCRLAVREGKDPKTVLRPHDGPDVPTFGECAREYIKGREPAWRNAKHRYQWHATLLGEVLTRDGKVAFTPDGEPKKSRPDFCAALRARPVNEVTTEDVLKVLQPLWKTNIETATRLRQRIEAVLDAAKPLGHRDGDNPARWRGHLKYLLPAPKKLARVKHFAAMRFEEVPAFITKVRDAEGVAARGLEFAIVTAARSGEVRGARWCEIDLAAKVWTVPGERMKAGREHRVPLSDPAIAVLREAAKMRMTSAVDALVFPGNREGRPMSDMAMTMVLRRLEVDVTVHGFRSSFRDWCGDCTSYPRDLVETALAHIVGDEVERAYRRRDGLERRRELMEAWAGYCEPRAANVVRLRRRRVLS